MVRSVLLVVLFVAVAAAVPLQDSHSADNVVGKDEESLMDKLNSRCSKREASACLMLKLVTYVNRLLKKADIPLGDGLEISQTRQVAEEPLDSSGRGFETEEEAVGSLIAQKMWSFVKSRSVRWEVIPGSEVVLSTTPDQDGQLSLDLALRETAGGQEGRGKKNNMGPLLAAGAMKVGMMGILAFKALALLVGKALLVSKLAFLLAAIIGLKKLFSQQKHVTYEVVAHPHHSHSHVSEHGHGGGGGDSYSSAWGRSIEPAASSDPHTLAYSAHAPK
ncbi:unnamed protein product [Nezara viridula]|uniref:Neuropeptide n=1 Tax=Nezara viridula TaxID=85310 RepID=A0A9P0MWL4_NEZVI|nr:unnamed protein product [Nezara viridula]